MKSINRSIIICIILLVSITLISSLFFLLTTDVQAKNVLTMNVSGPIITNTTWTAANSPYILTDDVTINEGITLTIEPDVTVMGEIGTLLAVNGRLEAIGTPSQPITFTSSVDSWAGLYIEDEGSAHLNHAVVEYGYSTNIGISTDSAFITKIENSVIQESYDQAMVIAVSSLHLVELDNVTFVNNPQNRIYIRYHVDTSPLIDNATLTAQPGLEGYEVEFFDGLSEFFIPTGVTLTLTPDVTFLIHGPIMVNGRLDAIGTPSQPITFTSSEYNWGLHIVEEGSTHLNHTVLEHGYTNVDIRTIESAPISKIENSVIQDSYYQPISINANALHLVELDNVTFVNNPRNRIYIRYHVDTSPLIDNATLTTQPGLDGYEVEFSDSYYVFEIPASITLTVAPDVTLFIPEMAFVDVYGRLEAIGTPSQPITFTSIATNTTNTYLWRGITVNGGSTNLVHTRIQQSINNGLSILDGSVSARCSTFTNNLGSGIFVDATAQGNIQLTYNSLESNTVAGLQNEKPAWLDARYTWWGAADGPSGNGSGSGDAATGNVFVTPWLTAPECQEEKPPIWQVFLPVIITSE